MSGTPCSYSPSPRSDCRASQSFPAVPLIHFPEGEPDKSTTTCFSWSRSGAKQRTGISRTDSIGLRSLREISRACGSSGVTRSVTGGEAVPADQTYRLRPHRPSRSITHRRLFSAPRSRPERWACTRSRSMSRIRWPTAIGRSRRTSAACSHPREHSCLYSTRECRWRSLR
jgi:hypothetical protein